jgi:transcription elongation GreA/GreB family factor
MNNDIYLLPEDRDYAQKRIFELEKEIQDLGADFSDAFNQSSETWHDNSPFEAVRDKQSMMAAELDKLRTLIRTASLVPPKKKRGAVSIGSKVTLSNGTCYRIAGKWTHKAGQPSDGIWWVSCETPIAVAMIGKKRNAEVQFAKIIATIISIED